MKQRFLWMLTAILFFCGVNQAWAQYPDPYFSDETRPNALSFLYDPPVNSMTPDVSSSVSQPLSEKSKAVGLYYDMLGRRLESVSAHSLYIHNGRKVVK